MKFYNLFSLLLFVLVLASCHKYDTEEEAFRSELPGNYDWKLSESLKENAGSGFPLYEYTPAVLGKNYGLRIRKNEKCFLFEDGKQIDSGEILNIEVEKIYSSNYSGMVSIYHYVTIDWNKRGNEIFKTGEHGGGFECETFPVNGHKNVFISENL